MIQLSRFLTIVFTYHVIFCAGFANAQPTVWDGEFSTLWFDALNWDNNVVPGMADDVIVDAPSPTDVDGNVTINSLTIGQNGVLNLQAGVCMEFGDVAIPLDNAGNINLGASAKLLLNNNNNSSGIIDLEENAEILVNGPVCLGGGGNILLGGGLFGGIGGMPQPNFLQLGMEVAGFGQIGNGNIEQIGIGKDGNINANVPNQPLVIRPGPGGCVVDGSFCVGFEAILELFGGPYAFSGGGVLNIEPGGTLKLHDDVEFNPGLICAIGEGIERRIQLAQGAEAQLISTTLKGPVFVDLETESIVNLNNVNVSNSSIQAMNAGLNIQNTTINNNNQSIFARNGANVQITESALNIDNGSIDVEGGSMVAIDQSTINFLNSVIHVDDASKVVFKDGAVLQGGKLMQLGEFAPAVAVVCVVEGATVLFKDFEFDSDFFDDGAGVLVQASAFFEFCGEVQNDLEIELQPENGNNTNLVVSGKFTNKKKVTASRDPSGDGMSVMRGDGGGDDEYVNEEGATTEGCGEMRDLQVTNCGTVEANEEDESLAVKDSTVTNEGRMMASGGGILEFLDSVMCNEGGTVEAGTGSMVKDRGKNDFKGGKYMTSVDALPDEPGTILLDTGFAGSRYTDTEFDGNISVVNGSTVILAGEIVNRQGFEFQPGNLNTDIELEGAVTLSGGGALQLGQGTRLMFGESLVLQNQAITGSGSFGNGISDIEIQQGSKIDANSPGEVLAVSQNGNAIVNQGLLQASGGGILELRGSSTGVYANNDGNIQALAGSTVRFDSSPSRIVGGVLKAVDTGTIEITQGSGPRFVDLTIDADLTAPNGAPISVEGTINYLGTLSTSSDIDVAAAGATITGGGEIKLNGPNGRIDGGNLNSLQLTGQTRLSGDGAIVNTSTVFNGAQIAPGQSIGTLNFFVGNQEQKIVGGTILDIEIGNATGTPGIDWDFISISGGGGASLNLADDNLPSGVVIKVTSLDANGDPGLLSGFEPDEELSFPIISALGSILNFDPSNFEIDASDFANKFDGQFAVVVSGNNDQDLVLKYLPYLLGDVNSDGSVNLLDVQPFIQQLQGKGKINPAADINCDGEVNLLDVQPFVDALTS